MDKVGVCALVLTLGLGPGAAHAAPPPAAWAQDGFGPGNTRYNPAESVINTGSFGKLKLRWTVKPAPGEPGCEPAQVAPRAVGDRVYLLDGGGVAAYNAATGGRLWRSTGFNLITAGPIVAGGLVLVADTRCDTNSSYDATLTALDAATGAVRWRTTADWTVDAAVADAGTIVTSGYCGTCSDAAHGVNAYHLGDGERVWQHRNEVLAGPVSAGGTILLRRTAGQAMTTAAPIGTGTQIWRVYLVPDAVAATPDGKQFYLHDNGGLSARAAADGQKAWEIPKEAGDLAADGRRVYVASAGRVNTYDAKTGRALWTRALTAPREPVVAGGLLYVLAGTGGLAVLSPVNGRPIGATTAYRGLTRHVVPAGGHLLTSQERAIRAYAP